MQDIEIAPLARSRLTALLSADRNERFDAMALRARKLLDGHVVWNVNATAQGGGVAEMLQTLLAYVRGAGVDTRWLVLSASPDFFVITKRLHNALHGSPATVDVGVPPSPSLSRTHCGRTSMTWCPWSVPDRRPPRSADRRSEGRLALPHRSRHTQRVDRVGLLPSWLDLSSVR